MIRSRKYFMLPATMLRSGIFASARGGSSALLLLCFFINSHLPAQQKTYCNPINIDYGYTPIPNFSGWGRHRATADPVIVLYNN
ncbi:MAG: hypothetical protein E6H08_14970, partial [Bacteroidetes bacterium]